MKHSIYLAYKAEIKDLANILPTDDKPMRRQSLNDFLDCRLRGGLNYTLLRGTVSQKQYDLYVNWLTSYVIERHNK